MTTLRHSSFSKMKTKRVRYMYTLGTSKRSRGHRNINYVINMSARVETSFASTRLGRKYFTGATINPAIDTRSEQDARTGE